jgi:hypothetical protein
MNWIRKWQSLQTQVENKTMILLQSGISVESSLYHVDHCLSQLDCFLTRFICVLILFDSIIAFCLPDRRNHQEIATQYAKHLTK